MYRSALTKLQEWKDKPNRKPLIIRGARQVGKITYFQIYMPMFLQKQELLEEITFETDFSYLGDLK